MNNRNKSALPDVKVLEEKASIMTMAVILHKYMESLKAPLPGWDEAKEIYGNAIDAALFQALTTLPGDRFAAFAARGKRHPEPVLVWSDGTIENEKGESVFKGSTIAEAMQWLQGAN
jgi:hypothetical protein